MFLNWLVISKYTKMFVWTVINGQAKKIEDESADNKSMMIDRQQTKTIQNSCIAFISTV